MLTLVRKHLNKLFLLGVLIATVSAATTIAYASDICLVQEGGGSTWWVSCGSSAGNYLYRCDSGGCVDCDTPECNSYANQLCGACGGYSY
jgi:hypothetical protein